MPRGPPDRSWPACSQTATGPGSGLGSESPTLSSTTTYPFPINIARPRAAVLQTRQTHLAHYRRNPSQFYKLAACPMPQFAGCVLSAANLGVNGTLLGRPATVAAGPPS